MKKRTAGILLGIAVCAASLSGCGNNKATEAANESAETEKEGNGEESGAEASKEGEDTGETEESTALKVGVLLPVEDGGRWSRDASVMEEKLTDAGYAPRILYANEDVSMQVSQIGELLEEDVSALIIAPVDVYALPDALAQAKEKSVPVFSYDRLIMDTDAVSYYTAFDAREAGQMIGNAIVKEKDLEKARENQEPRTIEFLMGSQDDGAALFLYNGIMEVLQEYLDDGTLVCNSQRTTFDDTGILRAGEGAAKSNLSRILADFYSGEEAPDIICAAGDKLALGAADALEEAGITPGGEGWPMITGAGCEAEAVKRVAEGRQAFSIFMDSRTLAEECVNMADTYLKGEKPEVKDYEQYDNGRKIIGTYTCDSQLIDKDNYRLLIDNGLYTEEEIEPENTPAPSPAPGEKEPEETPVPEETLALSPAPGGTEPSKVTEPPKVTEVPRATEAPQAAETPKAADKGEAVPSGTPAP